MAQLTIQQTFDLASEHHGAGRFREAEQLYQQILAAFPRHADALHNMGVLAQQVGQPRAAVDLFRRSIAARPDNADAHSNLGVALRAVGQLQESVAACQAAIALRPDNAKAFFNLGVALQDLQRHDEAAAALRSAVKCAPDYFQAISALGVSLAETGDLDGAINSCRRAIAINPAYAMAHNVMGVAALKKKQFDIAIKAFERAIELRGNYDEAISNLAAAYRGKGDLSAAVSAYRRVVALKSADASAQCNLANALAADKQFDEAVAIFQRVLHVEPGYVPAAVGLAEAYLQSGQVQQAVEACRQALVLSPNNAEVMNNMAVALVGAQRAEAAIPFLRDALRLKPDFVDAWSNLAMALNKIGDTDEAIDASRQALKVNPKQQEALSNLGDALRDQGRLDEAIATYRQAISFGTDSRVIHESLCFALNLHPELPPRVVADEHRKWDRLYTAPLRSFMQPHANSRSVDRMLRIGYVSPDFFGHPVSCFMLPLLKSHDRSQFRIYCYSDVASPDAITDQIKSVVDVYHPITGLTDARVARMIRDDQIDILVDLAGHTLGNRLRMFATQPAPVSATFLGYPATTGLRAIDYRISDMLADPPGMTEEFCSEEIIRLPRTAWCYQPLSPFPPVEALPARQNGYVTFGCFNHFGKVNQPLLRCWAQILQRVEGSRLLIKARSLRSPAVQHRVRQTMLDYGIEPARLDLRSWVASGDHLKLYNQIDIALDTFPYNGTTTTCEALSMCVPVVVLAGKSHVARVGVSMMTNLGLPELVGTNVEEYIAAATALAKDFPRLEQLHATLAQRLALSPLMDGPAFARDMEAAFGRMFAAWADNPQARESFTA